MRSFRLGQRKADVYYAVINGSEITLPENLLEYYASGV